MPGWLNTRFLRIFLLHAAVSILLPSAVFADRLRVGGTGAALGAMRVLAEAFSELHPDIAVFVPPCLGSGGGIRAVTAGALDIGLSSRRLKDKEIEDGAKQTAYARTPFVFVTSHKGGGLDLTTAQVVEIYAEKQRQWGDGTSIRLILRPDTDTDTTVLKTAFREIGPALVHAQAIRGVPTAATDREALYKAENIPGSFATSTLAAVITEHRSVNLIAIDGAAPTVENIVIGTYRLVRNLYLVTGPELSQSAKKFIRFIQSKIGAGILRKTGNQPLVAGGGNRR